MTTTKNHLFPKKFAVKTDGTLDITNKVLGFLGSEGIIHTGWGYVVYRNGMYRVHDQIPNDIYIIIDYKDFFQIVDREQEEKKEVIGYKLKSPNFEDVIKSILKDKNSLGWWEQNSKDNFKWSGWNFTNSEISGSICQIFRDMKVLDIFFDEVVQTTNIEQIKEGDWVTILDTTNIRKYNSSTIGKTVKLEINDSQKMKEEFFKGQVPITLVGNSFSTNYWITDFRLATIEEVVNNTEQQETLIQIDGYTEELLPSIKVIKFGCVHINESRLDAYIYLLESDAIATITIRNVEITLEMLYSLKNKLKKLNNVNETEDLPF